MSEGTAYHDRLRQRVEFLRKWIKEQPKEDVAMIEEIMIDTLEALCEIHSRLLKM